MAFSKVLSLGRREYECPFHLPYEQVVAFIMCSGNSQDLFLRFIP